MWRPWFVYRKAIGRQGADNVRKWKAGGFRRPSRTSRLVMSLGLLPPEQRAFFGAPHPSLSLKLLRQVVRTVLPLAERTILDPFAGAGDLAGGCGLLSTGVGVGRTVFTSSMACKAILKLALTTKAIASSYQSNSLSSFLMPSCGRVVVRVSSSPRIFLKSSVVTLPR